MSLDPKFQEEFRRLIALIEELEGIIKAIEEYSELWVKAYEALKPIRSGKPIVLWQGTYEPYPGNSQEVYVYMGTGFLCRWEYWERGKDLFSEDSYSAPYFRNRVEELLKMPILDFLHQNLDIILEKCRASIRDDLEFLLRHPPLPIKLNEVSIEAEDIAIIQGRVILSYPRARLSVASSWRGPELTLKYTDQEYWTLSPRDFWNANLRAALLQLLEKTLETWKSQLPSDFYDNIKRLKEIIKIRKLARLLHNSDLEV